MRRSLLLATTLLLAGAIPACAQGVRGWTSSSVRYLEMRPIPTVEAPEPEVIGATLGSLDVGFTAWGFGVQGLSFTGLVRARDSFAGELAWSRYDDPFDLMIGYGELRRGAVRLRLGRQNTPSGLGFSGFDGADLRVDGGRLWAQAFGGRSLARGLAETRREALRGLEDFIPDQEAWLAGGAAGWDDGRSRVSLRYQREIWEDRSSLVSERAALDGATRIGLFRLRGALDWDIPFGRVGKASLSVQRLIRGGRTLLEVEARRYLPYFDLSTIWGFFSPVPYHEARIRVANGGSDIGVTAEAGIRDYGDPATVTILAPLEDRGWFAELGGSWNASPELRLEAAWTLDWGTSAFLHSVDARFGWSPSPALALGVSGTSFQQFEGWRVGDGRAWGVGGDGRAAITDRIDLELGVFVMRHDAGRGEVGDLWTQTRAWSGLRIGFGADPGLARVRR